MFEWWYRNEDNEWYKQQGVEHDMIHFSQGKLPANELTYKKYCPNKLVQ